MRTPLLCLLLSALPVVAAPAPLAKPERRAGLEQFQGEWQVLSQLSYTCFVADKEVVRGWYDHHTPVAVVVIRGGRCRWHTPPDDNRVDELRWVGPGAIDLTDLSSGA